jgi:caa(3)-type oxidase subunit IV
MSAHGHAAEHAGHAVHRNYVKIWAILVVLLAISVAGPFLNIRVITLITAFGVALVKAYMVAKNFMHLDVEKPIIHWLLAVILVLMVLLFAGVAPDVMKDQGRHWKKGPGFHALTSEHVEAGHEAGSEAGHGAPNH